MPGQMSATDIIRMWVSAHQVKLTELQQEKLDTAIELIAEGCYQAGKKAAWEEAVDMEETQATRDSVHGSDSEA